MSTMLGHMTSDSARGTGREAGAQGGPKGPKVAQGGA